MRRAAFTPFDETMNGGETVEWLSRLKPSRVRVLDEIVLLRRVHGDNTTLQRPLVAGELPRGGAPRDRPQPGDAGVSVAEHDLLLRATLGPDDDGPRRLRALARTGRSRDHRPRVAARARAARRASRRPAGRRGRRQGAADRALHVAAHAGVARACHARGPPSRRNPAFRSMLIEGAAVLAHTGWRVARRPMDDLDIAVPRSFATQAIEALRRLRLPALVRPHPRAPRRDPRDGLP